MAPNAQADWIAALAALSLQRPQPFGAKAPTGRAALDLTWWDLASHPEYGLTPAMILMAFRAAEGGDPTIQNDLFDGTIEGDAHLRSLFEKREQAVAGKPRVLQPGDDSDEARASTEALRVALNALPIVETFEHLLRYNRHGYAACEIDWNLRTIGGREWVVPTWFAPVPVRRFRIAQNDELRIFTDYRTTCGDPLIPGKWITLRRGGDQLARAGLMRTAMLLAMGKRMGFRDWMVWLEKFGVPIPIAKYDPTNDDLSKEMAAEIVRSIGETSGAVCPKGIEIEFPEAKRHGESGSVHPAMLAFCNAELSKLVNGSTLTNDNAGSGGASYALGSVHDGVRWEAVQYDADRIQAAFERDVCAAMIAFNRLRCAPSKMTIQVVRDLDPMTRAKVAAVYRNELGGKLSGQQMGTELGFRPPTDPSDELPGRAAPATRSENA